MDSSRANGKQIGRPAWKRSPELASQICNLLSEGFSVRYVCSELGFTPTLIFDWIASDPEFAKQYARAREIQAEGLADRIIELADSATPETANAVRLQVDSRKWVAAKLLPKKYGDVPNQTNFNQTIVIPVLSQEKQQELQERKRKLLEG